jgi:hypothetical protein
MMGLGGAYIDAQYDVAAPGSRALRIAGYQRRKMLDGFLAIGIASSDT